MRASPRDCALGGGRNLDPSVFHAPGGDLSTRARRLCGTRREVPAEVDDVLLLDLYVRHERGELVFTFELSWDLRGTLQPCEIAVGPPPTPSVDANAPGRAARVLHGSRDPRRHLLDDVANEAEPARTASDPQPGGPALG